MTRVDVRRDGFMLALLGVLVVLLVAGLMGAYRVFGFALVMFLGMVSALGFVRRDDRATWIPPVIATTVLLVAFAGMFANESAPVASARDTLLGFQPGTAFLIYGIWIPAFFTLGLGFTLVFHRLADNREGR